jgi:hypothetical protein
MLNDEIKKRCQPTLTFQTHDSVIKSKASYIEKW